MTGSAQLLFLGARGSIPVSGPVFARYGGNTTSLAISSNGSLVGIIDAGTGLVRLDDYNLKVPDQLTIVFTHYHWDHIQGLSMLPELWRGGHDFLFIGGDDPERHLTGAIRPPWFPVALAESACVTRYGSVAGPIEMDDVSVVAFPVHHPQGAVGYRLQSPTGTIAVVTDHESTPESDDVVAAAIGSADTLIHDAQYRPQEIDTRIGWGHSTWADAVAMAARIDADRLILTSHGPERTDDQIDAIVAEARERFPATEAAHEGMKIAF